MLTTAPNHHMFLSGIKALWTIHKGDPMDRYTRIGEEDPSVDQPCFEAKTGHPHTVTETYWDQTMPSGHRDPQSKEPIIGTLMVGVTPNDGYRQKTMRLFDWERRFRPEPPQD